MPRTRVEPLARRLVAAALALALLGAVVALVDTVASTRTTADRRAGSARIERSGGRQEPLQYRSAALRPGPRVSVRTAPNRLSSRLLATWTAAALLVPAGSWWSRTGSFDRVDSRVAPRVSLHPRGPPA